MQSLFYLNLLLLILILVLCISSISCSYTDLDSSTLLHSVTPSDFSNLSISKVLYRTVSYSDTQRQHYCLYLYIFLWHHIRLFILYLLWFASVICDQNNLPIEVRVLF